MSDTPTKEDLRENLTSKEWLRYASDKLAITTHCVQCGQGWRIRIEDWKPWKKQFCDVGCAMAYDAAKRLRAND